MLKVPHGPSGARSADKSYAAFWDRCSAVAKNTDWRHNVFHLALHFIVPLVVALVWYRLDWKKVYLLLMVGLAVDIDHLWASPIYDPTRCSIGFHPLHGAIPIIIYALMFAYSKTRIIGLGLLLHMALDAIDCIMIANA